MMAWVRFVGTRLVASVVLLLVLMSVIFALSVVLVPGDFATQYKLSLSPAEIDALRSELAIDEGLWTQYTTWMARIIRGDLGASFTGLDVGDVVMSVLPFTVLLLVVGVGAAFGIGMIGGSSLGWKRRSLGDAALVVVSSTSTLFPPWLAFLLAYGVADRLGLGFWIRIRQLDNQLWTSVETTPTSVAWAILGGVAISMAGVTIGGYYRRRARSVGVGRLSMLVFGLVGVASGWAYMLRAADAAQIVDVASLLALPIVAVAIVNLADTMLLVATLTASQRVAPYVLAARAKGLSERQIVRRHVRRITILPILSRYVANLPLVLGGLVIIEAAFGAGGSDYGVPVPGLSRTVFGAIATNDIPLAMGALVVIGLVTVAARLFLDIAHATLDPRYLEKPASL